METKGPDSDSITTGESSCDYTLGGVRITPSPTLDRNIPPGTIIDDFVVLEQIGPGGCGIVYKAQQRSIPRIVALKVIRLELASPALLERFELEKKTLAKLRDEHIVDVISAGTTSPQHGSVPYFVMEYVDGLPITKYADKKRLVIERRLELFLQLCAAIQHAHKHGVVHRDIKPSNVLVMEKDGGEPFVKVIDFGIARVLDNNLSTEFATRTGQVMGTLEYMSPQQLSGDSHAIDERCDIYALGVVLYELLISQQPLDVTPEIAKECRSSSFQERKLDPPSTRLPSLDKQLAEKIAKARDTSVEKLREALAGRLDAISLQCLAPKLEERFDSVASLAKAISQAKGNLNDPVVSIFGAIIPLVVVAFIAYGIWDSVKTKKAEEDNREISSPVAQINNVRAARPLSLSKEDILTPNDIITYMLNYLNDGRTGALPGTKDP